MDYSNKKPNSANARGHYIRNENLHFLTKCIFKIDKICYGDIKIVTMIFPKEQKADIESFVHVS